MILIYSDSQIIELDWLPNITFPDEYTIVHSFEEFRDSTNVTKIAFTTHRLHCDYDINCAAYQGFEDKINQLSSISQLVFTFESELHDHHFKIWNNCFNDNVYWVLPGYVNDHDEINSRIICWGDWFKTTALLYQRLPDKLAEITPYSTKSKYFDALLGSPKPHRDFVYHAVHNCSLTDKIVAPYGGDWKENEFYAKDYFIWEDGTEPCGDIIGTANYVKYHGHLTHLSQVIPIKVFNDTAYSIITETDYLNSYCCFTEKTSKPMLARRLFIVFAGYKFLYNLRKLGFQTFDSVIDESYDLIPSEQERWSAAFEQVKYLCTQDQQEIYNKIQPIVEHNYEIAYYRDWTHWSANQIQTVISDRL
jgi:hypothetical protein